MHALTQAAGCFLRPPRPPQNPTAPHTPVRLQAQREQMRWGGRSLEQALSGSSMGDGARFMAGVSYGQPNLQQQLQQHQQEQQHSRTLPLGPSTTPLHGGSIMKAIMATGHWQELEELLHSHARVLNNRHVSALVCRLPKLVTPAALTSEERHKFNAFLGSVSEAVQPRLKDFDARGIANVLWSVSKLGYSPSPPLLNKFLWESYQRMDDFNAQELANISWALATMGHKPVRVWVRRFVDSAQRAVHQLKPQELMHLAWALAKLSPPALPVPTGEDAGEEGSGAAGSEADAGPRPSASASQSPQEQHQQQERRQHVEDEVQRRRLGGLLVEAAVELLPHFRCGELVQALTTLVRLDEASARRRLLQPALELVLGGRHGPELTPQDLACMWSLMAGLVPAQRPGGGASQPQRQHRQEHGRLLQLTAASLERHGARELGATLVALARLQLQPPASLLHSLYARYLEVLPAGANYHTAYLTIWAMAKLRLAPPAPLMARLLACARIQMAAARKPCEVVGLLWALLRLRYQPDGAFMEAVTEALQRFDVTLMRLPPMTTILNAYAAFGHLPPAALLPRILACSQQRIAGSGFANVVAFAVGLSCMGVGTRSPSQGHLSRDWIRQVRTTMLASSSSNGGGSGAPSALAVQGALALSALVGSGSVASAASSSSSSSSGTVPHRGHVSFQPFWTAAVEAEVMRCLAAGQPHSPAATAALLLSLSRLKLQPSHACLEALLAEGAFDAARLTPGQAGELLSGLSWLRYRPPRAFIVRVVAALEPGIESLDDVQLVKVARALSVLAFKPGPAWMLRLLVACQPRLRRWPELQLRAFLVALKKLGVRMRGSPCDKLSAAVDSVNTRVAEEWAYAEDGDSVTPGRARIRRAAGAGGVRPPVSKLSRLLCSVCSEDRGCSVE